MFDFEEKLKLWLLIICLIFVTVLLVVLDKNMINFAIDETMKTNSSLVMEDENAIKMDLKILEKKTEHNRFSTYYKLILEYNDAKEECMVSLNYYTSVNAGDFISCYISQNKKGAYTITPYISKDD